MMSSNKCLNKKLRYLFSLYVVLFFVLISASACTEVEEPVVYKEVVEEVVGEDEEEQIAMDSERFAFVRLEVQNQLSVFDTSLYDKPLMDLINSKIEGSVSEQRAKQIVNSALEDLLPQWHRQIVIDTLNFEVGEGLYCNDDVEHIINTTSITPLKSLIKGYAMTKLKYEGKLK